jgi:hypothetical protein
MMIRGKGCESQKLTRVAVLGAKARDVLGGLCIIHAVGGRRDIIHKIRFCEKLAIEDGVVDGTARSSVIVRERALQKQKPSARRS